MLDYITGRTASSPREAFIYVTDEGEIAGVRRGDWKVLFLENRGQAFEVWREPLARLRVPLLFNLRRDPYELAQHNANVYNDWFQSVGFRVSWAMEAIMGFLKSLQEYPPSQKPGSWDINMVKKQIEAMSKKEQ